MKIFFFFFSFFLFCSSLPSLSSSLSSSSFDSWDVDDIPNPMISPHLCGRNNQESSSICDVSSLLNEESKDFIENRINKMFEVEFAVVIIPKMKTKSFFTSIHKEAERYSNTLLKKWGVGDTLNNGVLIFLSIYDRIIFISLGKEIQLKLSSIEVNRIISHVTPLLKQHDYSSAIERAIIEINIIITRGMTSLTIQQKQKDNKIYMARIIGPFILFIILIIMLFWIFISSNNEKQLKKFRESLRSLIVELILPDMDIKTNSFQLFSSSCPICFELYPSSIYKTTENSLREILKIQLIDENNENFIHIVDETAEDTSLIGEEYEINLLHLIEFGTKLRQTQFSSPKYQIQLNNNQQNNNIHEEETQNLLSEEENNNPNYKISIISSSESKINYRNPIYYNCGHIFCSSCLKSLLKEKVSNYCPLCENNLLFNNQNNQVNENDQNNQGSENNNDDNISSSDLSHSSTTFTTINTQPIAELKRRDLLYRFQQIVKLFNKFTTTEILNTIENSLKSGNREESIKLVLNLCIEINKLIIEIEMKKRHIDDKYKESRPPVHRNLDPQTKIE